MATSSQYILILNELFSGITELGPLTFSCALKGEECRAMPGRFMNRPYGTPRFHRQELSSTSCHESTLGCCNLLPCFSRESFENCYYTSSLTGKQPSDILFYSKHGKRTLRTCPSKPQRQDGQAVDLRVLRVYVETRMPPMFGKESRISLYVVLRLFPTRRFLF